MDHRELIERKGKQVPAPILLIAAIVLLQIRSELAEPTMNTGNAMSLTFLRVAIGSAMFFSFVRPEGIHPS